MGISEKNIFFARLQDARTGLYYQSPGYVYSFLNSELSLCDYRK